MPRQVNRCCEPKVLSYDLVPMSGALVLRVDGQPIALSSKTGEGKKEVWSAITRLCTESKK